MEQVIKPFEMLTTRSVGREVARIKQAFETKHQMEAAIARMIRKWEDETGLAIDMIHYQRDITIPIRGAKYTSLSIVIKPEE